MRKPKELISQTKDKIIHEVNSYGYCKMSTCDHPNWDVQLHHLMPKIIASLRKEGYGHTSKVNWGVTDHVFTVLL